MTGAPMSSQRIQDNAGRRKSIAIIDFTRPNACFQVRRPVEVKVNLVEP